MLPPFDYHQPASLHEALALLAALPGPKKVLAGGTDLVPALRRGDISPAHVVSLKRLDWMREIKIENGYIRVGALATFSRLAEFPLFKEHYHLLAGAALQVGGPQVRNQGTIGGNIVNASPAGDLLPPLTALEARVRICREGGQRVLPLDEFLVGLGETRIAPEEILTEVIFPVLPPRAASSFVKLGRRNSLAISRISMAAIVVCGDGEDIEEARIALGGVGPKPVRVTAAEALLCGRRPTPALLEEVLTAIAGDVAARLGSRASAPYKNVAVRGVAREALTAALPVFRNYN